MTLSLSRMNFIRKGHAAEFRSPGVVAHPGALKVHQAIYLPGLYDKPNSGLLLSPVRFDYPTRTVSPGQNIGSLPAGPGHIPWW